MLPRKLAAFCVCIFPTYFQRRLKRRTRYALEFAHSIREELRTRDVVLQRYGHLAREVPVESSRSVNKVVIEFEGLAIVVTFKGDDVEHAYYIHGDDVLDFETNRLYPWILSDEFRDFAISKGIMKSDDR